MRLFARSSTLAAAVVLAGCATTGRAPAPATTSSATAELTDAQGNAVGTARAVQEAAGVRITIELRGVPGGVHGVHLHAVGLCMAPDFASAGGHFDPGGRQHGLQNPEGPHAGDLQNVVVGPDGTGSGTFLNPRVTLGAGAASLFDADGTAIVVHAGPDDQVTDPSGSSGPRIACGVFRR